MVRFLKRFVGAFVCLAVLGLAPHARAGFTVTLSQSGGNGNPSSLTLTETSAGVIRFADTYGAFDLDLTVKSNYPGTSTGALLQTIDIATRNSDPGQKTLTIAIVSDGSAAFTLPGGNGTDLTVKSTLASSENGSTVTTYDSKIDSQALAQLKLTSGALGPLTDTISYVRGSSFSLSATLAMKLNTDQTAQFSATTKATGPAPTPASEPASLALLLTGGIALGVGGWSHRRLRAAI